jgi:hypothetical protein
MRKHIFYIQRWSIPSKGFEGVLRFEGFVVLKNKFISQMVSPYKERRLISSGMSVKEYRVAY